MKKKKAVKKKTKRAKKQSKPLADGIPVSCSFTEIAAIESLKPNPANPNVHSEGQIELLAKLIKSHSWRHPITVSNRSGMIVAGHARYKAAKLLGVETVPVDRQDFKDWAEEHAVLIADNVIAELAETDGQIMADLLVELDRLNYDLDLTALSVDQIRDYIGGPLDVNDVYRGMPEFDQSGEDCFKAIVVRFVSGDDYAAFSKLIKQNLTPDTKSIWYPKRDQDQENREKEYSSRAE